MNTKQKRSQWTAEAQRIVAELSLEEKVALMGGHVSAEECGKDFFAARPDLHYNWRPYPAGGNARLGVPELKFCDGPRGVVTGRSTCFPAAVGRGASFDPELEEEIGEAIGKEIRAHGGNFFGGVCVNLPRHPGWGRAQEVYGEDSHHLGVLGSALVRGVQKHDVIACVKHFAFNSMENARFKVDVAADDRTQYEVYLPHFKACIDAGAASVMSAYNSYRGQPAGHNRPLLTDILKNQWGFDGFVVSDFIWGVKETAPAANAGLDVEMCHTLFYGDKLVEAVRAGTVPEAAVDEAALRIVRTLLAAERSPHPQAYPASLVASAEHRALALRAAERSMTLVKNEGVLPLSKSIASLAVLGPLADTANIGDHGSSQVFPPYAVTPLAGLKALLPGADVRYEAEAEWVKGADAAVVVVGCGHGDEGEFVPADESNAAVGGDRASLSLRPAEVELIRKTAALNPRTIVVLIGGSTILMDEWQQLVPSILFAYYPGMEGGTALAKTLFGDVNPGGKLPFVIPRSAADLPSVDWEAESINYGYYHGYAKLDKENKKPLFDYGHGLSYTSFRVSNPQFRQEGSELVASCTLENTGAVAGDEVVQLYVGFSRSRVDRPVKALRGFQRVTLAAGKTASVTLSCPLDQLRWYNPQTKMWELEAMVHEVYLGTSSASASLHAGTIELKEGNS